MLKFLFDVSPICSSRVEPDSFGHLLDEKIKVDP
ncbi:hypothetical protein X726_03565 [Mesorhizobium sp. L103C105A0]|nr:hypothetical protein X726_03565 [Mesorhizobium sp. L103C105A0]